MAVAGEEKVLVGGGNNCFDIIAFLMEQYFLEGMELFPIIRDIRLE